MTLDRFSFAEKILLSKTLEHLSKVLSYSVFSLKSRKNCKKDERYSIFTSFFFFGKKNMRVEKDGRLRSSNCERKKRGYLVFYVIVERVFIEKYFEFSFLYNARLYMFISVYLVYEGAGIVIPEAALLSRVLDSVDRVVIRY